MKHFPFAGGCTADSVGSSQTDLGAALKIFDDVLFQFHHRPISTFHSFEFVR